MTCFLIIGLLLLFIIGLQVMNVKQYEQLQKQRLKIDRLEGNLEMLTGEWDEL